VTEIDSIKMEQKIKTVLEAYHQRIEKENALMRSLPIEEGMKMRDDFLLPVGEEVGQFLNTLIKGAKSKTILEVGTSYGYSTVWLAEAAKQTGGKVITLEIDQKKSVYTKEQLQKAGLANHVDFRVGDALELIEASAESFDFVLIDIWKELYVPSFHKVLPKLNNEAFVVADNIIFPPHHKKEAVAYRKAVRETKIFDSVLLPIGSGLEVSKLKKL